jgi:mannose-6-phosphate isomerase-like protein (cupin superfamily)
VKINHLKQLETQTVSHNRAISKKVMLNCDDIAPITQFAQATFPPGTKAPAHSHSDMIEVFFIEQGFGRIVVDGQSHAISAGSSIAIEVGESHELENTGDEAMIVSYFSVRV